MVVDLESYLDTLNHVVLSSHDENHLKIQLTTTDNLVYS